MIYGPRSVRKRALDLAKRVRAETMACGGHTDENQVSIEGDQGTAFLVDEWVIRAIMVALQGGK